MRGRPPKNNQLKILSGSKRAKKMTRRPKVDTPMWPCPDHVINHGKELWNTVGPVLLTNGIMNELDRSCFAMLCSTYDRLMKFQAILREDGPILEDKQGRMKKHPIATIISQHESLLKTYCQDFGMTPASRSRLGFTIDGVGQENNDFDKF
jgi:P27 family predicted phage terminase small subunit